MKTRFSLDTRRTFLALSGVVILILVCLTGVSVLIIWDSKTRLELLHEQAEMLADAQDKLLNLLVIEQNWLDVRTGAGDVAMEAEVDRRDSLLQSMDGIVQEAEATLEALRTSKNNYASLSELTAAGVALLIVVLVVLILVAKERVLKPMWKLADMLGRLAREDYRTEPLDGLDAFIRPAFERYNRLVGRLARLENAHQSRHQRMETQVREAARVLVAQRAELARVERLAAVGEMAASLAHEVRNPLAAIRSACRSLIEDAGEEDVRERLRMIDEEVERLANVVNRELHSTRHRPEEPDRTDVTDLVSSLVNLMKYQMPDSVTLRMDIPGSVTLRLPPNGLRQALLNLIKNSQETLEGREGDILIAVAERCGEKEVEIRVEDNGSGFPQEILANGIHRFVTGKKGGTGLGLAMVERYVRDQGGRMEIENRPEGGARVRIVLPRREQTDGRAT
jgi:two-component system, NtrC family, sensor kinase